MSSSDVVLKAGQKLSSPRRYLRKAAFNLSRRMKLTLRVFVMLQISVGVICLYKTITLSSYTNDKNIVTGNKYDKKNRNIREFTQSRIGNTAPLNNIQPTRKPLPLCPKTPPGLLGKVKLDFSNYEMEQVEKNYKSLQNGGRFKPRSCIARHRVAIIIPYRNRKEHLIKLMNNLHSILQRQQLDYGIYVIEVAPMSDFNRALSLNIGFQEASREYDYQCFIFHDVDLLPENDRNMYTCPTDPRHMSVAVDRLKYKLPYATIFGGVVAMTKEHFLTVNGFSNKFFGWGGEDDDMYKRINYTHLNITRYKPKIARYRMLAHRKDSSVNTERFYLLRHTNDTWRTDGLNSLTYRHIKTDRHRLFTYVLVDIDPAHPAYYTDRLKIVEESIRKMREDFNKSKENDLSTESTGANSSLASKGVNSSRLVVARSEQNMRTLMPNQSINSTTGTLITDKPKHLGALHPIQQFMLSLKELLTDKKEEDINSISDKELASFVRVYVNNLRKAGFSINNELHFKKDTVIKTKSDTKPKLDKIVKYINANKKW